MAGNASKTPRAVAAAEAPARTRAPAYPVIFHGQTGGRIKRPLGDLFGLANFGVNLTTLEPGARSALQHRHSRQDEFVYVLSGEAVLVTGTTETIMHAGMCAGFPAGGESHHLDNRTDRPVHFLEVGDRTGGDEVEYPHDDLVATMKDGQRVFTRKDGTPY